MLHKYGWIWPKKLHAKVYRIAEVYCAHVHAYKRLINMPLRRHVELLAANKINNETLDQKTKVAKTEDKKGHQSKGNIFIGFADIRFVGWNDFWYFKHFSIRLCVFFPSISLWFILLLFLSNLPRFVWVFFLSHGRFCEAIHRRQGSAKTNK